MKRLFLYICLILLFAFSYKNTDLHYSINITTQDSGVFYGKSYKNDIKIQFQIIYKKKNNQLTVKDVKYFANGVEQKNQRIDETIYYATIDKKKGFIIGQRLKGPEIPFSANFTELFPKFEKGKKKKWFRMYSMAKNVIARIDYSILERKKDKIIIKENIKADIGGTNNLYGEIKGEGVITYRDGVIEKSDVTIFSNVIEKLQGTEIRRASTTTKILMIKE